MKCLPKQFSLILTVFPSFTR